MTTALINRIKGIAIIFLFGIAIVSTLNSCEKRVTQHKTERIIVKDTWSITNFLFEGQNIELMYAGQTLDFSDNGRISVVPFSGVSGSWNAGLGKNPSLLYISGFIDSNYFAFNDDWTVTTISKQSIRLESDNGGELNKITLTKVEE